MYVYVFVCVYMYVCMYVCMCMHACRYMYVCICVRACMYYTNIASSIYCTYHIIMEIIFVRQNTPLRWTGFEIDKSLLLSITYTHITHSTAQRGHSTHSARSLHPLTQSPSTHPLSQATTRTNPLSEATSPTHPPGQSTPVQCYAVGVALV